MAKFLVLRNLSPFGSEVIYKLASRVAESCLSFSSRNNRTLHHPCFNVISCRILQFTPTYSKAYDTLCLAATTLATLKILPICYIALIYEEVFYRFQVWRLLTNFIFLGPFSINFGIHLLMILRYGVQLENGPFNRRPADLLWMMIFGASILLSFYLPWAMLALDVIFGSPIWPDLCGILAGHLYYFLTVLHPSAG